MNGSGLRRSHGRTRSLWMCKDLIERVYILYLVLHPSFESRLFVHLLSPHPLVHVIDMVSVIKFICQLADPGVDFCCNQGSSSPYLA